MVGVYDIEKIWYEYLSGEGTFGEYDQCVIDIINREYGYFDLLLNEFEKYKEVFSKREDIEVIYNNGYSLGEYLFEIGFYYELKGNLNKISVIVRESDYVKPIILSVNRAFNKNFTYMEYSTIDFGNKDKECIDIFKKMLDDLDKREYKNLTKYGI